MVVGSSPVVVTYKDIDYNLLSLDDNSLTQALLYGDKRFTEISNSRLLSSINEYILSAKRLDNLSQFVIMLLLTYVMKYLASTELFISFYTIVF